MVPGHRNGYGLDLRYSVPPHTHTHKHRALQAWLQPLVLLEVIHSLVDGTQEKEVAVSDVPHEGFWGTVVSSRFPLLLPAAMK